MPAGAAAPPVDAPNGCRRMCPRIAGNRPRSPAALRSPATGGGGSGRYRRGQPSSRGSPRSTRSSPGRSLEDALRFGADRIGAHGIGSRVTRGAGMTVCRRSVASWKPQRVGDPGLDRVATRENRCQSPPSDTSTRRFPCSEHVDNCETDLNPHGFPREVPGEHLVGIGRPEPPTQTPTATSQVLCSRDDLRMASIAARSSTRSRSVSHRTIGQPTRMSVTSTQVGGDVAHEVVLASIGPVVVATEQSG